MPVSNNDMLRRLKTQIMLDVSCLCAVWFSNGDFLDFEALTTYNTHSIGNVEQCQAVKEWNPDAPYDTHLCSLSYPLTVSHLYVTTKKNSYSLTQ